MSIESERSAYEEDLFREGPYQCNFDKELSEAERSLLANIEAYSSGDDTTPDELEQFRGISADIERQHLVCKQRYSGRIPLGWGSGEEQKIIQDMEEAGRRGAQLSETLVDAGVSHFNQETAMSTGMNMKLNPRQMAVLMVRAEFPYVRTLSISYLDKIKAHQRKAGMAEKEQYWQEHSLGDTPELKSGE